MMIFWFAGMLLSPLVGAIVNGLLLRTSHNRRAGVIATTAVAISFCSALKLSIEIASGSEKVIMFAIPFFEVGAKSFVWGFSFDALTTVMALVVTGIGTLIHLYSIGYMAEEKKAYRYFTYLNFFLFQMLLLISSDNLLGIFVGWEGVGLCSYLLIGYWYEDPEKSKAGMKAFVINRIGDVGFLIGMFLCLSFFNTLNISEIAAQLGAPSSLDPRWLNLLALAFFFGATGKSAQIPLFTWLPDAMAGPTPVSALIHAATMVTAGIYLIARLSFLFQITQTTNHVITIIGAATALIAALIGTSQKDIKKVLAYSTVSQLGLMFVALGSRAYFAAIFHVMTHAFFKALLFLGSGSVIHGMHGEQDIFKMGGLAKKMPITFITFAIGTIAICGLPPLAGFFSKDTILFETLALNRYGLFFWSVAFLASMLTCFYMIRLLVLVFLGAPRYGSEVHPHESPLTMTIPLIVLAVGSALVGLLGMPHSLHLLPNYLEHFLSASLVQIPLGTPAIPEMAAMLITTSSALAVVAFSFVLYRRFGDFNFLFNKFVGIRTLCASKFWIDELYQLLYVQPFNQIGKLLSSFVDPKLIDGCVRLPAWITKQGSLALSSLNTGVIQTYLFWMVLGLTAILWSLGKGVAF